MTGWKNPGLPGAVLYGLVAVLLGSLVTVVSRLRIAKFRGRRRAVRALPDGPIIIVSNHASYADGVLLALICRRLGRSVRLLATAGVFRTPGLGWLVRRLGFISVERGSIRAAGALGPAVEALAAGQAIGIFPEGRTTRDPNHWPERAKTGAVRLALQTGAPVVPIAMVGTYRVVNKQRPIRSILTNVILRPEVLTEVGAPMDLVAMLGDDEPTPAKVRELSDEMMGRIVDLVESLRDEVAPNRTGLKPTSDEGPNEPDAASISR